MTCLHETGPVIDLKPDLDYYCLCVLQIGKIDMSFAEGTVISQQENRFPSSPVGYLWGKIGLLVILAGLLLAAWYGQTVIVILLGLVLSAAGLSKLWS